jgi:hypothetical protein
MKPKEFDELVRQKFDQNDFAYNPKNWDQLAEKLDGRAQKRSVIMWWWVPLAGMAASVALAVGIAPMFRQNETANKGAVVATVQARKFVQPAEQPMQSPIITTETAPSHKEVLYASAANNGHKQHNAKTENAADWFHVVLNDKPGNTVAKTDKDFNFAAGNPNKPMAQSKKEQKIALNEGYNTFIPEEEAPVKAPKVLIILSGGYNHGSQNSGYMAGATFRRMINTKLYIESDVDFATSNNSQSTEVWIPSAGKGGSAARHLAAKNSTQEASKTAAVSAPQGSIKTEDENYNLSYAQVSPSIGYKIINRMSVAVGPDFQQMLVDNRPATSTVDRGNIQVAPVFDVGFVGKTEYSLTKKVKAGISYRKGMNDFINPVNKFIDRDYLQFQLKCTIFNK